MIAVLATCAVVLALAVAFGVLLADASMWIRGRRRNRL